MSRLWTQRKQFGAMPLVDEIQLEKQRAKSRSTHSGALVLLALLGCSACAGPRVDLLSTYEAQSGISPKFFHQLEAWKALPAWARPAAVLRNDWLKTLHSNVTRKSWPKPLREATARIITGRSDLGMSFDRGAERAIGVFDSTPAWLTELFRILNYPFLAPDSVDPNAKMLFDKSRIPETIDQLRRFQGMLAETGYVDASETRWGGAVIMATRFIYYHELGHLSRSLGPSEKPSWILPEETEFAEELLADQFAFALIMLELRHHRELQDIGFCGIALALSLVAAREFSEKEFDGGRRRIKGAVFRMARLLEWARRGIQTGELKKEAVAAGEFYWRTFEELLHGVDEMPSPIFSLLRETADQPTERWSLARDHLVRWLVFGDRNKVLSIVGRIHASALKQAPTEPRAGRVLEVFRFLLNETAALEPELGLRKAVGP